MDIVLFNFEDPIIIQLKNSKLKFTLFHTSEPGNIKFGIDAPRSIKVDREEIYLKSQNQENTE